MSSEPLNDNNLRVTDIDDSPLNGARDVATLIVTRPEFRTPEALDRIHEEVVRLIYSSLDEAEKLTASIAVAAEATGNPEVEAISLRCSGHVHYARSRAAEAVASYSRAIELLDRLGREGDLARTLSSGSQALIYRGRYVEAEEWIARAKEIFTRLGDHLRLGRLSSNLGNVLFRQDRYEEALAEYRNALPCLEQQGRPSDVAAVLSNIATCCTSVGRFEEALTAYTRVRELCVDHRLSLIVAADYNIAYLYYLRGDYRRAMELYGESRAHCQEQGDEYHAALCDLDESEMYLELNLTAKARQLAAEAALRFEKLGRGYEQGKSLVNQAIAASVQEDMAFALETFERARAIFEGEGNRVWPALIDLYLATVFESAGDDEKALQKCEAALGTLAGTPLGAKTAVSVLLRARLLAKRGRAAEALSSHAHARELIEASEANSLRFEERYVLGQIKEQLGDPEAALAAYEECRLEIEKARGRLFTEELRISFLKDKGALYESLVALSLGSGAGGVHRAIDYIEQAKSRNLAEQMAFSVLGTNNGDGLSASPQLQEMRRDLNACYRRLEQLRLEDSTEHQPQIRAMQSHLNDQEARYRDARRLTSAPLSATPYCLCEEEIRASLPGDAVLLNYYESRGALYVCVMSRKASRLTPLGSAAKIKQLARLFHFQMTKVGLGPAYLKNFESSMRRTAESHLHELYRELIEPVRAMLDAPDLIVAPYDFLHGLPFAALFDGQRFLMDDFAITTAPSASVYTLCNRRSAGKRQGSIVMGFSTDESPEIQEEASQVAKALPDARLFLNGEATEEALRAFAPGSRFIHIASHGIFRQDNPVFSFVRLNDCCLNLMDLYRIPTGAELVTLSGCSTGRNAVSGGDELLGLMRGLLSAGARSLLLTLWDVSDRSTATFMVSFYKQLAITGDKARAAGSAMRELRESYPNPYSWAPFVLVGAGKIE